MTVRRDRRALVERRDDHDRRSGSAQGRLASWIDRFGFGRPTGIDFPGERPGIALPLDQWSGSTIGNVPIGQGIAVTPLQMAARTRRSPTAACSSRPHLVDRIDGQPIALTQGTSRRLAPRSRSRCWRCFADVVARGHGHRGRDPRLHRRRQDRYRREGRPNGRYSTSRYVASFVGLVPATKPRLVILVMVDEPHGQHLRRRRRRAGVPRDRALQPAVPRGAAGRTADDEARPLAAVSERRGAASRTVAWARCRPPRPCTSLTARGARRPDRARSRRAR